MTIRKPVNGAGGQGAISSSYPANPTSPVRSLPQSPSNGSNFRKASLGPRAEGSPGERDGARNVGGTSAQESIIDPLPSIPGYDKSGFSIDTASHPDALPAPLQISRPASYSKISSDSHRPPPSLPPDISSNTLNGLPQDSARISSNSNNPYFRNASSSPLSHTDQANDASSANIWASEPNNLGSPTYSETSYAQQGASIKHTIEPGAVKEEYSPICPTPFDEPRMNSATAQTPKQPYQDHNMSGGTNWASSNSEPRYRSSSGVPQCYHKGAPMELSVPIPYSFQEPEASWRAGYSYPGNPDRGPQIPNEQGDILRPVTSSIGNGVSVPASSTSPQDANVVPRPTQPKIDTSVNGANGVVSQPQLQTDENKSRKQESETYQIRLVNWFDTSSRTNPRRSPIMVQNANGPCPLLALVNALVLSTPAGLETALVDTLERREQISLGLLLDAVIDELMSGRRGDAAQNLPDVSELYVFLVNLHTGMNVNPRFIAPEIRSPNLMDAPIQEPHTKENFPGTRFAGSFEDTREMQLYSTFAVPLIHGWMPPRNHPAFAALERSAKSYEDAQNLLFAEEELENKLQQQGLNPNEQLLLEDISSIKYFLSSSATQLTGYGLDSITESLNPGQIAILFRNDHFSTLYRHPRSGQLFTLVTDMGYAGHDEVVWESLVDVSGEGCEFFAGDFRPVGNNQPRSSHAASNDDGGWTTVTRGSGSKASRNPLAGNQAVTAGRAFHENSVPGLSALSLHDLEDTSKSPNTEQEDHDLALALQLQEEEEERERQEISARKRENELSQAFLESQPAIRGRTVKGKPQSNPSLPPRSSHQRAPGSRNGQGSPVVRAGAATANTRTRPVKTGESEDAPPPTYEQAAQGPAYHPPPSHPAHPNASNSTPSHLPRPPGRQRHSSAYSQHSAALADSPVASSPISPPSANPPSLTSHSRRLGSFRNPTPTRGGLGGVEGAAGVYRRDEDPGLAGHEAAKRGDCLVM